MCKIDDGEIVYNRAIQGQCKTFRGPIVLRYEEFTSQLGKIDHPYWFFDELQKQHGERLLDRRN